jgi:hypothetical protein
MARGRRRRGPGGIFGEGGRHGCGAAPRRPARTGPGASAAHSPIAARDLAPARVAATATASTAPSACRRTTTQVDNELTDPEVAALEGWMATGGVLMTGDHANQRPGGADPNLDELLNLGRAIGHRVPRAGALRRWEGNPAQYDDEETGRFTYNTQVPTPQADIDDLALQEDEFPQRLILKTFPPPGGGPLDPATPFGQRVHRLFCGRIAPITVFPDHMHEGHLVIPSTFPQDIWPSGPSGQPLPEVIAQGTDKKTGDIRDIVIAYDGSSAGVGRIVADSTWHHYFNVNLKGFPPGGHIRSLARFYVNLAVWLSPPAKRAQIACWLRWKLLHSATVQMAFGNPRFVLGREAASVLRRLAGPCVIQDVIVFAPLLVAPARAEALQPSEELMLGGVLHAHLEAFQRADAGQDIGREEDVNTLLVRGIRAAHDDFVDGLDRAAARARRARDFLEEQLGRDGYSTDS